MPKNPEKNFEPKFEEKIKKETKEEKELKLVECPHCGKPIRNDISFCHHCGERVKEKLVESSFEQEKENE